MKNINSDHARIRIAIDLLNRKEVKSKDRIRAYEILDNLLVIGNSKYESNLNFSYSVDPQVTMNIIHNRARGVNFF